MAESGSSSGNKKKVLCPECETEVELVDGEGDCSKCGLDVGYCYEMRRRQKAIDKLVKRESEEGPTPKRRRRGFGL